MVAIDSARHALPADPDRRGGIVLAAFAVCALLAALSWLLAVDGNGWALASNMVSRFSLLLFVALVTVEPVARLVPIALTKMAARAQGGLVLGFITAQALALLFLVAPSRLVEGRLALQTVAFCAVTACILVVFALVSLKMVERRFGGPATRTLRGIANAYFWLVFVLTGLEGSIGPHRPDSWYGISLLLLTFALLVRFADAFAAQRRPAAGKVD
ncbi:MAG TPA: hypothetical protein VGB91_04740 [Rhizomicrobium sp.]